MSDFHVDRTVKTRKPHRCEQCGTVIEPGSVATRGTGTYCGDFYSHYVHGECRKAGDAYAKLTGYWGDEYTWFQHTDELPEIAGWLIANHPVVAGRLGLPRP